MLKWTHVHPTTPGWYWVEDSTDNHSLTQESETTFCKLCEDCTSPTGWAWEDPWGNGDWAMPEHMIETPKIRYAYLPYPEE
jgi:hypothetical protein